MYCIRILWTNETKEVKEKQISKQSKKNFDFAIMPFISLQRSQFDSCQSSFSFFKINFSDSN